MGTGAPSLLAERERFELSRRYQRLPAFEAGAFNHSTTSPWSPPLREERSQLRRGFVGEHPVDDVDAMVHRGRTEYIDDRSRRPSLGVAAAEHQPLDARRGERAGAHRTGLLRDVERAAD